ncbi:outer dynein arm-docking complex subunit 1-like isoform X1 [Syngnathus typhle]|uniref:outer dynein arm-docking complex subunit 1-like isoform X1 n=1 Tax=Syngnathus typhle TaxID=161592 RepID=UPI002A6B3A01|nr:outer dynein arm-docking complex subunit 1-like isoform X1 [Syngnathus typhle]XP_061127604.1 outer dynein arm-docking complex subunit 1-like isoform X1 [Syngnathus typhle]XP_061127606.1 outer dynein arm-docking complex subunit 1-like isoform X1 [Syngnathus typhle]
MRRSVRGRSQEENPENDLQKLKLQYRQAVKDKQAYDDKIEALLQKDSREIQRLQTEHDEMQHILTVAQSNSNQKKEVNATSDLNSLLNNEEKIEEELQLNKVKLGVFKKEIEIWERKLVAQRGLTAPHNAKCEDTSIKDILSKEDKLYKGHICFNELMIRNGQLKQEIDTLEMQKSEFLQIQLQLRKELQALRKEISDLSAMCTKANNASVIIQVKQKKLKEQKAQFEAQYTQTTTNLEHEIAIHCNLEVMVNVKNAGDEGSDREKEDLLEHLERLTYLEDTIRKILIETGESDLDTLMENFLALEEENYSLLSYVNSQHWHIEDIKHQIAQLYKESEFFVTEQKQQAQDRQALQAAISTKQKTIEEQLSGYKQRIAFLEKIVNRLKKGVQTLLDISYESRDMSSTLSSCDGPLDDHMTACLKLVEEKVSEFLNLQSVILFQETLTQCDLASDGFGSIADQFRGKGNTPAVNLSAAASTPPPEEDKARKGSRSASKGGNERMASQGSTQVERKHED